MWRVSFLLMLWAAASLLGAAFLTKFVSSEIIVDAEGNAVKAGVPYYAIRSPELIFRFRGITVGMYYEIPALEQAPPFENCIPLIFNPWPAKEDGSLHEEGVIETSQNLTISFGKNNIVTTDAICFVEEDPVAEKTFVPVVPVEASSDPKYFLFKIEQGQILGYKFVSCAFPRCMHLTDNDEHFFTLSAHENDVFYFVLRKYEDKLAEIK